MLLDAGSNNITVGNTSGAASLTLKAGTGNIDVGATSQARSINIGTGSAIQAITLGSTWSTSTLVLQAGNGDSLTFDMRSTTGNWLFRTTSSAPGLAGGQNVIFIGNRYTAPSSATSQGGVLYAASGALRWRGSSNSDNQIAPAGPHCGICGYDCWRVSIMNYTWKSFHFECAHCRQEYKGGPETVHEYLDDQQKKEYLQPGMTFDQVAAVMNQDVATPEKKGG